MIRSDVIDFIDRLGVCCGEWIVVDNNPKLLQATTDKKQLANVENILKKSNRKLEELQQEMGELDAYQIEKSSDGSDEAKGKYALLSQCGGYYSGDF